jgi:hypothetical protein
MVTVFLINLSTVIFLRTLVHGVNSEECGLYLDCWRQRVPIEWTQHVREVAHTRIHKYTHGWPVSISYNMAFSEMFSRFV